MWNVWDLSLGQSLSVGFVFGCIGYFMAKALEQLRRISTSLEAIATHLSRVEKR